MRNSIGTLSLALLIGALCAPALATGTARIQQSDGSVKTYTGVKIVVVHRTLRMTSSDGQGTVILSHAACSAVGDLLRCLPDSATLEQHGSTYTIALKDGTVWFNRSQTTAQLPLSSTQLPPHGVLLSFSTPKGTYVSLSGTVDSVTK